MATATTRIRAQKQTEFTNANTWGGLLNTTVFDPFDEAFARKEVVVDADKTLTVEDYISDEARSLMLVFTGAGGFIVTVPALDKPYIVFNQCSADVDMKPLGGTSATVRAGTGATFFTTGGDNLTGNVIDPTLDKILSASGNVDFGGFKALQVADGDAGSTDGTNVLQVENLIASASSINLPSTIGHEGDTLRVNDSAIPEWQTATPSGQKTFTADGDIDAGEFVVVNSDGTVSPVSGTFANASVGASVVFESAGASYMSSCYDAANDRVVIVYRDDGNSGHGTAVVGTVSGTSISFGTPVVFEAASVLHTACTYDSVNEKVVISYQDAGNSSRGTCIVGTVSGTSISFGSAVVFKTTATTYINSTYDVTNEKIVIAYIASGCRSIVGTVSGTSISFGTETLLDGSGLYYVSANYDADAEKVLVCYSRSSEAYALVGTVSGTSISFGSAATFVSQRGQYIVSEYDVDKQKNIIAYYAQGGSEGTYAVVATISGTDVTFGAATEITASSSIYLSLVYSTSSKKVSVTYATQQRGVALSSQVSIENGSVSLSAPVTVNATTSLDVISVYSSGGDKIIVSFGDSANSSYGTSVVYQCECEVTDADSWIGAASADILDTEDGVVTIVGGTNAEQTGLTPGATYYLEGDGTISTSSTFGRRAGKAVSATELLITP